MSIEAINWALNTAPIPDGRTASTLTIVLVGLANHADPDGRNAFPAVATLVRYTRLSERSVRSALHNLEQLGLIAPSDPDIVAAYIRRADRRPNGWDLLIHTTIHNTIHSDTGVQPLHPADPNGVQNQPNGVHTTTPRGARPAPEPSLNHPKNQTARETTKPTAASPDGLPPVCGQCDARPGDPPNARVVWLDARRQDFQPCPRCHRRTLTGDR